MDRESLIQKVYNPRFVDYGYAIAFFVIFGFFVLGIIWPNITTVFELRQKYIDLQSINKDYTATIDNLTKLQLILASRQSDLSLLTEAVPPQVYVSEIIDDLTSISDAPTISLPKFEVGATDKTLPSQTKAPPGQPASPKPTVQTYKVKVQVTGNYEHVRESYEKLYNQLRLKTITAFALSANNQATASGEFVADIDTESYYQ